MVIYAVGCLRRVWALSCSEWYSCHIESHLIHTISNHHCKCPEIFCLPTLSNHFCVYNLSAYRETNFIQRWGSKAAFSIGPSPCAAIRHTPSCVHSFCGWRLFLHAFSLLVAGSSSLACPVLLRFVTPQVLANKLGTFLPRLGYAQNVHRLLHML